ncbi:MAG TPA: glycoside hydrolase domain-containing protein, partial [Rhodothermia bacterium]
MRSRLLALSIVAASVLAASAQSPAELVDPFIGTAGGGNTFPGAVVPWGMVSVSPHNAPGSPSGYVHGEPYFYGLGHTHLSGTGCSDYGSVLLMVTDLRAGRRPQGGLWPAPTGGVARSTYRNETASPGFYSVVLDSPAVLIEASATLRSGITRFTSLESGTIALLLNAGTSLGITGGGEVRIAGNGDDGSSASVSGPRVKARRGIARQGDAGPGVTVEPGVTESRHSGAGRNPGTGNLDADVESSESRAVVIGHNIGGGMCGELNRHLTYFSAEIDREPVASGTWVGDEASEEPFVSAADLSLGAWLTFDVEAGESIEVRVGISYVSTENAHLNVTMEQGDKTFSTIWKEAKADWDDRLSRISVTTGSRDERTKFYTALYHSLIHPNVMDDVNGEYPLMGRGGVGIVSGRHRYSVYSLWDTYRTVHPLLTLLFPEIQGDMVQTMIDMNVENGWLPKWELGANETYLMVGDAAAIVVADTYVKGVRSFDVEKAFEAVVKATTVSANGDAPLIRPGYHDLVLNGYIPADQDTTEEWWVWGPVSTMLEYNL